MLPSQQELKTTIETVIPEFDWHNCPEKFRTIFLNLITSQEKILNLANQNIIDINNEILIVCNFLAAYPHITTLDISGNYLSSLNISALICQKTLKDLRINDNMPLEPDLIQNPHDPNKLLAARNSDCIRMICVENCRYYNQTLQPGCFKNNQTLKRLELRNSFINDTGVNTLAKIENLQYLDIRYNPEISIDGLQPLMTKVNKLKEQKLTFLRGTLQRQGHAPVKIFSADLLNKIFEYLSFQLIKGPFPLEYALRPLVSLNPFTHKTNILNKVFRWFFPDHTTLHPMFPEAITRSLIDLNEVATLHTTQLTSHDNSVCSSPLIYTLPNTQTTEQKIAQEQANVDSSSLSPESASIVPAISSPPSVEPIVSRERYKPLK